MNTLEALVGTMTVAELAKRSNRRVDEIVAYAMNGQVAKPKLSLVRPQTTPVPEVDAKSAKPSKASSRIGRVGQAVVAPPRDTKTPTGRAKYEDAIIEALVGQGWMLAQEVRLHAGGTPLQARTALNRLVQRGAVEHRGQARATEYRLLKP